jgi:hypothetical protein
VVPKEPRAEEPVVLPDVLLVLLLGLASYPSLWHEQHRHHEMDSLVLDSEWVNLG